MLGAVLGILLLAGGFELYERISYHFWHKNFTFLEWNGKLTMPSKNETLMWAYRPNTTVQNVHINGFGFRDRDLSSKAKPSNRYRIAVVGDEVTVGLKLASVEDTFVRQYEKLVNRKRSEQKVETLNLGIDGYNGVQVAELIRKKAVSFQPDLVLYAMNLNDFDLLGSSGLKIFYFRKPENFLLYRLAQLRERLSTKTRYRYYFDKNLDRVMSELLGVKRLLAEKKIRFWVLILSDFPFEYGAYFDSYQDFDIHRDLHRLFQKHGIQYVDTLPDFLLNQNTPLREMAYDAVLPKTEGHTIIARRLFYHLKF